MEQGFLNKSNKNSLKDGQISSMLSSLAKKVKSTSGKLLGEDGKPLKPYRCVNDKVGSLANDAACVMGNIMIDGEVGSLTSTSARSENNHDVVCNTSNETDIPICVGSKVMEDAALSLADVVLPQAEVELISARLENSLYGYFVGQRPAFPVVQNFVRNVWKKYGLMHVMIHQGFFIFQFSSKEGMDDVLNHGPWRIRSVPLILKVWSPSSDLKREEVKKVAVWVKMFNVPIVAYSKVGLDMIASKLGRLLMLDEHTSNMCLNSWGMNAYARMLVEISAENDFVNSLVVAVPIAKTKEHRLVTIDIEFEYKPPRCSVCKTFDHIDKECHNKVKEVNQKTGMVDGLEADKRKSKVANKVKVSGKPKMIYTPVSKPSYNNHATTSMPKENSVPKVTNEVTNEGNTTDLHVPPLVSTDELSQSYNEYGYFQDNINIADLKSTIDKLWEENKVLDLASNSPNVEDVGKGSELHINKEIPNIMSTPPVEGDMVK
jgi:hypothetical protein